MQVSVATILSGCCLNAEHQSVLTKAGAIVALAPLLSSHASAIQMSALRCFAALCYRNRAASVQLCESSWAGVGLLDHIQLLLRQDNPMELQVF